MINRSAGKIALGALLVSLLATALQGCCQLPAPAAGVVVGKPVPYTSDTEAVGSRSLSTEAMFVAERACPVGVECLFADVNADRRTDFVQLDRTGKLGKAGTVLVSYGSGWGFAKPRPQGTCTATEICRFGQMDGIGGLELVRFRRDSAEVWQSAVGDDYETGEERQVLVDDFCRAGATCHVVDLSGDGVSDLVAFDGAITVAYNDHGYFRKASLRRSDCARGRPCTFADVDGDRAAELVLLPQVSDGERMPLKVIQMGPGQAFSRSSFGDYDCSRYTCQMQDTDGDGIDDLLMTRDTSLYIFAPGESGFEHTASLSLPRCRGRRCFWADGNADGRADWVDIDGQGTLSVYPGEDSVQRMERAALSLTQLAQNYFRYRKSEAEYWLAEIERNAWDHPEGWPFTSPGEEWKAPPRPQPAIATGDYVSQGTALTTRITGEINTILAAIPAESAAMNGVAQRRWQGWLGRVVAARTAMYSLPLGTTRYSSTETCGNVVVHDRYRLEDGEHLEASYLSRYYEAFREPDQSRRIALAVGALTGLVEGLRCLSQGEIDRLEHGFVEAVSETMMDLLSRGQMLLARRTFDRALPVALVLFDVTKSFTRPQTWRLLQARIVGTSLVLPEVPGVGTDFAALTTKEQLGSTVFGQLYLNPERDSMEDHVLTLDEVLYLPDLQQDNRLVRLERMLPEDVVQGFLDLRNLGEGDCQLYEVATFGMNCKSPSTCNAAASITDPAGALLTPGEPGSAYSHFGTSRSAHAAHSSCSEPGSGGGGPGLGCVGPPTRRTSGRFSSDPTVDRQLRCAMELAGGTRSIVQVALNVNAACLSRGLVSVDTHDAQIAAEKPENRQELYRLFHDGSDAQQESYGRTRDQMIDTIIDAALRHGGPVPTRLQVIAAMQVLADHYFGGDGHISETELSYMDSRGPIAWAGNGVEMYYDADALAREATAVFDSVGMGMDEFVTGVYAHEFLHLVTDRLAQFGQMDRLSAIEDHDLITAPLGLNLLCAGGEDQCGQSCGVEGALARRMAECFDEPSRADPEAIRCAFAQDYCGDRRFGDLGFALPGNCVPSVGVGVNSDCFAVTCSESSPATSACCSAFRAGTIPNVFVPSVDPGPRPPPPAIPSFSELPFAAEQPK